MIRREFVRNTLAAALGAAGVGAAGVTPLRGAAGTGDWSADMAPDAGLVAAAAAADAASPAAEFPKAPGLTKSVAAFLVNTKYADIPKDVMELGRKSILDGFGLALAGSASVLAPLVRQYVEVLLLGFMKPRKRSERDRDGDEEPSALCGVRQRGIDPRRRFRRYAARRGQGPRLRPADASDRTYVAICIRALRTGKAQRPELMLAYQVGVEVGMQNRRGDCAAAL